MLQVNFKTVVIMQGLVNGDFEQNFVPFFRKNITPNSTSLGQGAKAIETSIILLIKNCEINKDL